MPEQMSGPFRSLVERLIAVVPGLAAAFILLLVGLFVARGLRSLVKRVLHRARLDDHASKLGAGELLARLGLGKSPTGLLGLLVYWFVLLVFFVSAANTMELPAVSQLLERFMLFVPSMIASILILFGGLLFARFLFEVVANAAAANGVRGGTALARASYAAVVVFTSLMVLEQLGIDTKFITSTIQILLASAGLAAAIAFGLGGKELAAEILRGALHKNRG